MASRQLTTEEVRDKFLDHVWSTIRSWQRAKGSNDEKVEGVAFSILAMLDGCVLGVPGFVVSPAPHPDDRQYLSNQGKNYFPVAPTVECDISGSLHELFWRKKDQ